MFLSVMFSFYLTVSERKKKQLWHIVATGKINGTSIKTLKNMLHELILSFNQEI